MENNQRKEQITLLDKAEDFVNRARMPEGIDEGVSVWTTKELLWLMVNFASKYGLSTLTGESKGLSEQEIREAAERLYPLDSNNIEWSAQQALKREAHIAALTAHPKQHKEKGAHTENGEWVI